MHWLAIMGIAVILRAFYSIGTKSSTTHIKIHHATLSTLLLFSSAVMTLLLSPLLGGIDFSGASEHWFKIAVMIVSLGIGGPIYFKGQSLVDAGTTQIALATKLVWTALLAIPLLGASYDILQVIGMVILAIGIIIVGRGVSSSTVSKGALIIAVSAIAFSVNSLFSADVASELSAVAYLLLSYVGAGIISLVTGLKYLKEDVRYIGQNASKTIRYAGLTAAISTLYFTSLYFAFREAGESRGLAAILTNAQVVTTVIVASFVLKEKDNLLRKVAASVLVLVASYLIAGI